MAELFYIDPVTGERRDAELHAEILQEDNPLVEFNFSLLVLKEQKKLAHNRGEKGVTGVYKISLDNFRATLENFKKERGLKDDPIYNRYMKQIKQVVGEDENVR
ncbi:MAG: hypothetical protein MPJ22_08495 [Pirellulales bacterium]|nr:hypothetical protein [Pirellulales bacterium]